MNRNAIRLAAVLALAVSTASMAAEEGFKPLFNGKDLTGWVTPEDKSLFKVEDGVIVGRTKGDLQKNEFLATDKAYGDFVLKAKIKFKGNNSGIQFRSVRKPDGVVSGPQADVAPGYWGLLYEERGRGILDQYPKEKAAALVREGAYNEFVITAKGDHVTISLNGTVVNDVTDPKFDKSGIIAFQLHVGKPTEIQVKDVEIKTLD
ncbi:3-keto-disaccharide hydrolase [Tundrisphaera lichenicola]|uniref:3-keto-disaccharide hydrolase n=1 Tax=Tundrisphaera lichenicola TaxID=2029860 RepID=UPI003EC13C40